MQEDFTDPQRNLIILGVIDAVIILLCTVYFGLKVRLTHKQWWIISTAFLFLQAFSVFFLLKFMLQKIEKPEKEKRDQMDGVSGGIS